MQQETDNIVILVVMGTVAMLLLAASVVLMQIRNQNRLLKQKEAAQLAEITHQKELLNAIITSQEAERKRIGQDLHDDIGAALSGLRLSMELYEPPAAELEKFIKFRQNSKEAIDAIIAELRHIAHHLSPSLLSLYGLHAALNKQLEFINRTNYLQASITNNAADELAALKIDTATAIYRVLEELLNNTIKHAKATNIDITFSVQKNLLVINYRDNGVGLPAHVKPGKGMGMQNIESRLSMIGAGYRVITSPGHGFEVNIEYPMMITEQING